MKISAPFLTFCLMAVSAGTSLVSQDTLYMKNGTRIASKILEITPTEIKYKKLDNIEGPTFTTHGSDISLVKYSNGTADTIKVDPPAKVAIKTPQAPAPPPDPHPAIYRQGPGFKYNGRHVNSRDAQKIMLSVNDPEINDHIKKVKISKGMGFLGFVAIPTALFGIGYSLYTLADSGGSSSADYAPGIASGVVAVACLGTAITFNVRKKHNLNKALSIYNEKY